MHRNRYLFDDISNLANIRPICIPDLEETNLYVGEQARIAGWGKTSDGTF